jgi:CheY-like chemotaxis protein/anti-sigma regulatory factor (Ser/Thr protein kinase)
VTSANAITAKRILIVDDDPDVHQLLTVALGTTGRYLECAFDGVEALTKFEAAPWDLVITDVFMPRMDGMELLARVRVLRPHTPVVVMTVDSTAEKIMTAIRDHAFSWFSKPFLEQDVRETVDRALEDQRPEQDIEVLSASPRWLELRLRCDLDTAARALHFVREMDPGLPEQDRDKVAMAFQEILFNAVEHGGKSDPNLYVTITYTRAEGALLFRVRDPGPGFSFARLKHSALSNPADSPAGHTANREEAGMRPGGFGILLTQSLVDELIYNEKGNEALLIKYLPRPDQTQL